MHLFKLFLEYACAVASALEVVELATVVGVAVRTILAVLDRVVTCPEIQNKTRKNAA